MLTIGQNSKTSGVRHKRRWIIRGPCMTHVSPVSGNILLLYKSIVAAISLLSIEYTKTVNFHVSDAYFCLYEATSKVKSVRLSFLLQYFTHLSSINFERNSRGTQNVDGITFTDQSPFNFF